jgi:hypothetical protein
MEKKEEMKLELERKIRMRDNLIKEQELYGKQVPEVKERLRIHQEGVRLLRENQKIILENFKIVKPTWDYETNPEYLANLKKLNLLNFQKVELDWKNQEESMLSTIKSADEQLVHSHQILDGIVNEIAKLESDLNGE